MPWYFHQPSSVCHFSWEVVAWDLHVVLSSAAVGVILWVSPLLFKSLSAVLLYFLCSVTVSSWDAHWNVVLRRELNGMLWTCPNHHQCHTWIVFQMVPIPVMTHIHWFWLKDCDNAPQAHIFEDCWHRLNGGCGHPAFWSILKNAEEIAHSNNNNDNRIQRRYSRFFTISFQRCKLSPTRMLKWPRCNRVQITCNTSSAYHVQLVMLRATWYEGTAQLLSLTELKSHLFELYFIGWIIRPMNHENPYLGREAETSVFQNELNRGNYLVGSADRDVDLPVMVAMCYHIGPR